MQMSSSQPTFGFVFHNVIAASLGTMAKKKGKLGPYELIVMSNLNSFCEQTHKTPADDEYVNTVPENFLLLIHDRLPKVGIKTWEEWGTLFSPFSLWIFQNSGKTLQDALSEGRVTDERRGREKRGITLIHFIRNLILAVITQIRCLKAVIDWFYTWSSVYSINIWGGFKSNLGFRAVWCGLQIILIALGYIAIGSINLNYGKSPQKHLINVGTGWRNQISQYFDYKPWNWYCDNVLGFKLYW